MDLLDNLAKATSSPSHRSINQGVPIVISVPDSKTGYLICAIYQGNFPQIVRYDGLSGNLSGGNADPKDGIVIIPTWHPLDNKAVLMEPGIYLLKVQAFDSMTAAVPQSWNIQFDIVSP